MRDERNADAAERVQQRAAGGGVRMSAGSCVVERSGEVVERMLDPKEVKPKAERPKKEKKERTPREPSLYNKFMKEELTRLKKDNPGMSHKEAFKVAAANWKTSPTNPANVGVGHPLRLSSTLSHLTRLSSDRFYRSVCALETQTLLSLSTL
ncbi:hypothetical protein M427DRAFT_37789 [Gonapodya prolifera JEL478]|uniref:YABBY protein C-terminal domain-containing protein n=1 Tax=Gonapodya prolifera (strain JEL478) TaxID=1344416 RepID=A0A139A055_GONPJ|nr:hypothetical protein M427DRAFT_37789 [Gonapodya prolifera JEL478]|eukprot:KXS10140.1 hypothetical protein M427DRAFT_37789 [Gonapodya prolifera JEL478]